VAKTKAADRIDAMMERASAALEATDYFTAEAEAAAALEAAHRAGDDDRMARILMPLEEARRQKRLLAADAGVAGRLCELPGPDWPDRPGCWLVEPPLVGADARELRRQADERRVPAIVICREPATDAGLWPVVVIGLKTVRAYVDPPEGGAPDTPWFLDAAEALGEAAIDTVDPARSARARVEDLIALVQTLRDHDRLHQALAQTCREAMREPAEPGRRAG